MGLNWTCDYKNTGFKPIALNIDSLYASRLFLNSDWSEFTLYL